ncbi:hypothetical protein K466DRAFT_595193 [Polyporus arcularius HHB13444]|uniref:Uncharacterized protein n=1 Tax=Polyporus arcularius HHB13444 TaxID=1314778 RepID=A0A5C3PSQ5_9APHY|nr:hypothetical protein K466DRAFT_595193 [Polyporus arcularius HHB13444]
MEVTVDLTTLVALLYLVLAVYLCSRMFGGEARDARRRAAGRDPVAPVAATQVAADVAAAARMGKDTSTAEPVGEGVAKAGLSKTVARGVRVSVPPSPLQCRQVALPMTPPPTVSSRKDARSRAVGARSTTPVGAPSFNQEPVAHSKGKEREHKAIPGPSGTRNATPGPSGTRSATPGPLSITSVGTLPIASPSPSPSVSTSPSSASLSLPSSRSPSPPPSQLAPAAGAAQDDVKDDVDDAMEVDSGLIKRDRKARFINAPPPSPSLAEAPRIGDIFLHIATGFDRPNYQMFLRVEGIDGRPGWWPVNKGYRRADGYRLNVTLVSQEPSWVKDSQYNKTVRAEQKSAASSQASTPVPIRTRRK